MNLEKTETPEQSKLEDLYQTLALLCDHSFSLRNGIWEIKNRLYRDPKLVSGKDNAETKEQPKEGFVGKTEQLLNDLSLSLQSMQSGLNELNRIV